MFYTIYKITNKINGKYYIGKHQTKNLNDGYMGSGKLIISALSKYGIENFTKEILFIFDNPQNMNDKEKELVVINENSYNLCPGGHGGFGFINDIGLNWTPEKNNKISGVKNFTPEQRSLYGTKGGRSMAERTRERNKKGKGVHKETPQLFTESALKKKAETFKERKHQQGERNSQYGSRWVTDGVINKKIKKGQEIPDNFKLGYTKVKLER